MKLTTFQKGIRLLGVTVLLIILFYIVRGFIISDNRGEDNVAFTTQSLASFNCENVTEIPKDECVALVDLYKKTDGNNWIDNKRWLKNTNPCSWRGVFCEEGHVVSLNLSRNNLKGQIPGNISRLSELFALQLGDNNLTGKIPAGLGTLKNLQHVELLRNSLSGNIPNGLGKVGSETSEIRLFLSDNNFCETVPETIITNEKIALFDIGNNNISLDEASYSGDQWAEINKKISKDNLKTQTPEYCQ